MYKKRMNKKTILVLWSVVGIIVLFSISYYIYNLYSGNNEYCQSLIKQKNISSEYSCKISKEYEQDGKIYIDITVHRPNNNEDRATYSMEKETKIIR